MYNFYLSIWYYFVGKPKVIEYIVVKPITPENLKFGLLDNGDYLYQYFIEEIVYFFWGDFLEGRPGRQIENYLEKILIATRWNQVETGFEILINHFDWIYINEYFYTWDQDWGEDMILAVDSTQGYDYIVNLFLWVIAFFYVFYIYWSNYITFSRMPGHLNFFDVFHQTEDQYFGYFQAQGLEPFNIFEDGMSIVPSWFYSDEDHMTTQDPEFEDHEYMDTADFCQHPSEESDLFLDYMFDARGYVHYDLFSSILDATVTHRFANAEDRLEPEDMIQGFDGTSMISSFWWDDYIAADYTHTYDQYTWQFKESRERNKHPYFFYHPLEHYNGIVDPWIMQELTWDYEPWLEDNFSVVIMGDIIVEEFVFSLITEDGAVEELVDEIDEENDYDYMDFEGLPLEHNDLDQLVSLPLWREYELISVEDEFGNKSNRTWMPELDWTIHPEAADDWDWEDWEEVFDEGSDGMYCDNDAVLEDAYLVSVMNNDVYFGNLNHDVYGGALPFADINDELVDVYIDYSTEFYLRDLLEGLSSYGRNEERLYSDLDSLSLDYSFVPIDRLLRHVSAWEFGNSIDYIMGTLLLDVSALSKESYGLLKTSAYQLNIIYQSLLDLQSGKIPEYPVRWNVNSLYYEVYNLETYTWVNIEEVIKYLVLDVELIYRSRKYLLGYSSDLLLKWSTISFEKSFNLNFVIIFDWFLYSGFKEYTYSLILIWVVCLEGVWDIILSIGSSLYLFLKKSCNYKNIDLVVSMLETFFSGKFYSNYFGIDLLAYDRSYVNYIFKTRCAVRLDLETVSQEEELYPVWWVRQGIFDQDFYLSQLHSFDPRNPISFWYDRAAVMTYPELVLVSCGNLDMVEIINTDYLSLTRKENPYLAVGFALDVKYYDYVILEGIYERDPSQWVNGCHFIRGSTLFTFLF